MGFLFKNYAFLLKDYTEEINNLDLYALLETEDINQFMEFIRLFGIIHNELPPNYLSELFYLGKLCDEDKIILAILLIVISRFQKSVDSVLGYLISKLLDERNRFQSDKSPYYLLQFLLYLLIENLYSFMSKRNSQDEKDLSNFFYELKGKLDFFRDDTLENKISMISKKLELRIKSAFGDNSKEIIEDFYVIKRDSVTYRKPILQKLFIIFVLIDKDNMNFLIDSANLGKVVEKANTYRFWIQSMIDAINYNMSKYDNDIIPFLVPFLDNSLYQVRLSTSIILWLISEDLMYIRRGIKKSTSEKEKKVRKAILKEPEKGWKRYKLEYDQLLRSFKKEIDISEKSRNRVSYHDQKLSYQFRIKNDLVELQGNQTLEELSDEIKSIFDLSEWHLYAFFMNNKPWSRYWSYFHPDAEGNSVRDIKIHELKLFPNQKFLYIYDFGSEFRVTIEFIGVKY